MTSADEKLKFVFNELMEGYNLLFTSIRTLYTEEPKDGKLYYPIAVPLLCFCFLDFLKRFDYIFKNGKDGNENRENSAKYKEFLNHFIINNDKYKKYNCSFTTDDLYEVRCDLVHSFSLKYLYDDGKKIIHFVGGSLAQKGIIEKLKEATKKRHPSVKKVYIITFFSFLEIIKEGLSRMLKEYQSLLMPETETGGPKVLTAHLDDLYNELESSTRFYRAIPK